MDRLLRSLRFIEDHLDEPFEATDVAAAASLSPWHFARIFQALTGDTVMGYVRRRRLTEAAQRLADGDPVRLIELALDSGFESQAAFTRAFKRQFGMPPGAVRKAGQTWLARCRWPLDATALAHLSETVTMEPTFTEREDIPVVGLSSTVQAGQSSDGPGQWRRFRSYVEKIKHRRGKDYLGVVEVVDKAAGTFRYSPAVEVSHIEDVPDGLTAKTLSGGRFAVFTHRLASRDIGGELRRTFGYIYGTWVPKAGVCLRAYYDLEVYDERFDSQALTGEIDIWVPVK